MLLGRVSKFKKIHVSIGICVCIIVSVGLQIGLDFSPRICKTDEDKASQKHALTTWVGSHWVLHGWVATGYCMGG